MKWLTRSIAPSMLALAALFAFLSPGGPKVKLHAADFTFAPAKLTVRAGTSIMILNDGKQTHTFSCPKCGASSGDIQPTAFGIVKLAKRGTYEFYCTYHRDEGMTGSVAIT